MDESLGISRSLDARVHPWHLRQPNHQDQQWFKNILEYHNLTKVWIRELELESANQRQLKRVLKPTFHQKLEALEALVEPKREGNLADLLDSAMPGEFLSRLEHTVKAVQAWILKGIFENTAVSEHAALLNLLQQTSWKTGRTCSRMRWGNFPPVHKNDLRAIVGAIEDSPLSGYPNSRTFLMKRYRKNNLECELRNCPHRSQYSEVLAMADKLCDLHSHWMRGFAYLINSKVLMEQTRTEPFTGTNPVQPVCQQIWGFL